MQSVMRVGALRPADLTQRTRGQRDVADRFAGLDGGQCGHVQHDHFRSDNGSEFTAKAVRNWLGRVGVKTLYIEPGSPCRSELGGLLKHYYRRAA